MKYIIANWKMNMALSDIRSWYSEFSELVQKGNISKDTQIILAPTSIHIPLVNEIFKDLPVKYATQDISEYDKGAHTGSLGSFQIKEFCEYTIVGHSEKSEDIDTVVLKRDMALKNSLTPIVCFTKPEDCIKVHVPGSLIAWEDPNNISLNGTYRAKDPNDIDTQATMISKMLPEGVVLIYGGSVNKENIGDISSMQSIQGVLVGNASLDPEHFYEIVLKFNA